MKKHPRGATRSSWLAPAVLITMLIGAAGCGGGDGGNSPEPPSAAELTGQGWSFFESAEFDSAAARFTAATGVDPHFADAWNGLGWARAYLGMLGTAATAFEQANTEGFAGADAWAGLAAVNREIDLAAGLAACDSALARSPGFVFGHDPEVNASDLHLVRAQIATYLDLLTVAQSEADFLRPGNGLDPGDPDTWVVGVDSYPSYLQALVRLLEDIEEGIGGDLP